MKHETTDDIKPPTMPDGSGSPTRDDHDWERQQESDDRALASLLNGEANGMPGGGGIPEEYMDANYTFDQSGKADDAEDFEDISDDDLPDEETIVPARAANDDTLLGDDDGAGEDLDDLWGEGEVNASSPMDVSPPTPPAASPRPDAMQVDLPAKPSQLTDFEINFPRADFSNQDPDIPAVATTELELVRSVYPTFDTGVCFDWNQLLPPKKATWVGKKPQKVPKPLAPTKLTLDLDVDQEKLFRVPGPASGTTRQRIRDAEAKGLCSCLVPEPIKEADLAIFSKELDDDNEVVGGFTLADIETICYDFEDMIDQAQPLSPPATPGEDANGDGEDDWDRMFLENQPPRKRRKIIVERGLPRVPRFEAPSFDQFEDATQRAAKRVHLDFADPYLLIEEQTAKRRKTDPKRMANSRLGRVAKSRFNASNDEHYEMLKINSKHKVRATIGNMAVEHSIPAIKLLWPYYAVKTDPINPHDYHRPTLQTSRNAGDWVRFVQPAHMGGKQRKEKRTQKVQEAFATSKDLSLNDRSTAVLFEYCEQIPTVLSKFGMGNKIVNHARKKANTDDESKVIDRAQYELGEANILMTEDKSPFSIFGRVDQGEVVQTLTNAMYHAPIFKHRPRKTDFICGRSHTGAEGSRYYLRKIDHLYVVGQNFPSMEVPGSHSRKVTTLSKNRMKMIAYRLIHRKESVELQEMTKHIKGSTDAQNRQKLKEFLSYDKNIKAWRIKEHDTLMDKDSIDRMIKPEEVCLNDAHQVGECELLINGYSTGAKHEEDADQYLGDDNSETAFARAMAPWNTTKAFIDACAGKAMVRLRGPGDPTGHGLGFSFIKTSMKGGYMEALQKDRGPGNTSADAMSLEAQRKDANGHSYNVKQQDELYNREIGEIWTKQRTTLSDPTEHDDEDMQPQGDEDDRFYATAGQSFGGGAPGRFASGSQVGVPPTPVSGGHRRGGSIVMDDRTSVFSRRSATEVGAASTTGGQRKVLRIYRKTSDGGEEQVEMVLDSSIIRKYLDERRKIKASEIDIFNDNVQFTGDQEHDESMLYRIKQEEARLIRNKERRLQREKSKNKLPLAAAAASAAARAGTPGAHDPDSPAPSIEKGAGGTTRKCANCGLVGHIKTNKKYGVSFNPGSGGGMVCYHVCRKCRRMRAGKGVTSGQGRRVSVP